MCDGVADVVPDDVHFLGDADVRGDELEDVVGELFLGEAVVAWGVREEAVAVVVGGDGVVSCLSEGFNDVPELI